MIHHSDRRNWHTATKKSENSHTFWYVLCLVRIKNPGPLHFKLTRFHCICFVVCHEQNKFLFLVFKFGPGVERLYAEIEINYDEDRENSEIFSIHLTEDRNGIAEVRVSLLALLTFHAFLVHRIRDSFTVKLRLHKC